MAEFDGKVALVTGGGRGIGAAVCARLARGGARVAILDRDRDEAEAVVRKLALEDLEASAFMTDVTDAGRVRDVVADVTCQFGAADILVNNAGISNPKPFLEISEDDWDATLDINLKGTFLMCKAVLPAMTERGSGRVVNLGSALSKQGVPNFAHYSASKFGVIGLTQSLAAEFGRYGITVNSVIPGIVETRLWSGSGGTVESFGSAEKANEYVRENIPLGRTQSAEDIAEMVAFLVSEKARNVTGGSYHVDGGMMPR